MHGSERWCFCSASTFPHSSLQLLPPSINYYSARIIVLFSCKCSSNSFYFTNISMPYFLLFSYKSGRNPYFHVAWTYWNTKNSCSYLHAYLNLRVCLYGLYIWNISYFLNLKMQHWHKIFKCHISIHHLNWVFNWFFNANSFWNRVQVDCLY